MAEQHHSFAGKGLFPPKYAFTLLIPFRNIFLSPQKLLQRLSLQAEQSVLEIGPGPGYFSPFVAKALPQGKLVLFDIQPEMLAMAQKRLEKRGCLNVEYRLSDGEQFDFPDAAFDRIFMVTVIGEVANQAAYLQAIHRVLKADGLLSISELAGDPDKLSMEELKALVEGFGFEEAERFGNRWNYTVNFRKTSN